MTSLTHAASGLAVRQLGWLLLVVLLLGQAVTAQADLQAAKTEVMRLSDFSAQAGPVRLYGVTEQRELFFPLAETRDIQDAVLSLRLVNSIALQDERSFLLVRFNETTLAQIPFDSKQPISDARVRLPAELWRKGFNKLTLAVNQHYTNSCEDATAPELWTELDLYHSHLELTHTGTSSELTLADLSNLFSPGIGGLEEALLVTAPDLDGSVNTASRVYREALPLAAQALALRRDYTSLEIRHQAWMKDRTPYMLAIEETELQLDPREAISYLETSEPFHLLLATREQLHSIMTPAEIDLIRGPYLRLQKVQPLVDQEGEVLVPGGVRLLVSGRDEEEVLQAARLLQEMDDRFNPVGEITLLERLQQNDQLPQASGRFLHPASSYSFADLQQPTATFQDMGSRRIRVNLPLPADYYAVESEHLELQLDFGYGAGMGPGSVMNVLVNGEYVHGLLLDQPGGSAFRNYRIRIPIRKLNPGINTLDFDVTLRPELVVGECAGIPGTHLVFQMQDTSRVILPDAAEVSVQPNLTLFANTGFPYVASGYKTPSEVILSSSDLTAGALTLVGRLAQAAGAPLENLQLKVGGQPSGHALMLGTPASLPDDLFSTWDLSLGRTQRWPYPALNDLRARLNQDEVSLFQASPEAISASRLSGQVHQRSGLGDLGVLVAFANPYSEEKATLTLVTAETESLLHERLLTLVTSPFWSQLQGDLFIWEEDPDQIAHLQVANRYELGEKDTWMKLRLILSNNPWYWLGGVLVVLLAFTLLAVKLLGKRRKELEAE
ncbi:cellulose biosynthesis cyclic di-GMP-binding regulatory protein BcsB [Marinospirillum perlucidum]|uniref:cellulose biosynthesis cyclic di-GMP-binding regulatory protein BcsB n=1 Tax=Marinospirillum perlucidum TaxID=1982602 RepID=UPI00138FB4A4|nr:cellulose biosynthesis cyclic di-GMP-binding regulatory protein BcsB [Marinospirillum perlucidum]